MVDGIPFPPIRGAAGALTCVLVLGACAHVSEDDFQAEMADIRAEMRAGDEEVERRVTDRVDALQARLDVLENELMALEEEFGARVERLEASIRVHTPVHFAFDDATLQARDREPLGRLASVLREHYPRALITVEGFTDPAGSVEYNLRLGQRRAESVQGWLVAEGGLSGSQVRAVSYGESPERQVRPGAAGPGEEGRENRRVVVVIDHPDVTPQRNVVTAGID